MNIQYLTRQQIDEQKWDACIDNADNGLFYAYSFYLDSMAKHWDALVLNDYEAVMPLTWNSKYGIHYLFQPFLTAQLGLFGKNTSAALLETFLKAIPKKFKYWDLNLNQSNVFGIEGYGLFQRSNYVLSLNKPYETLRASYRENIRRNIKKAEQAGCYVQKGFVVEELITLAVQQMKTQNQESTENIDRFRKLYSNLLEKKQATTYGIFLDKVLLASCAFFFSHRRAYYILVGNHPNGKNVGASHALIDAFIKDHAEQNILLDFEGSDIPSLAFFYSSFGAAEEKYAAIKLNKLPFYLKWLKK